MSIAGQRAHGEHLTEEEKAILRRDLGAGMTNSEAAIKHRCSCRVVCKYRRFWGIAPKKEYISARPEVRRRHAEFKKFEAKPNMAPGLTKEMLMSGRAPVAKLRRVE